MFTHAVADVLARALSELGLGYAELARVLLVNHATLYRWRTGATELSPRARFRLMALEHFLQELARAFPGMSARDWLVRPLCDFGGIAPRELLLAGRVDLLTGYLIGTRTRRGELAPAMA